MRRSREGAILGNGRGQASGEGHLEMHGPWEAAETVAYSHPSGNWGLTIS